MPLRRFVLGWGRGFDGVETGALLLVRAGGLDEPVLAGLERREGTWCGPDLHDRRRYRAPHRKNGIAWRGDAPLYVGLRIYATSDGEDNEANRAFAREPIEDVRACRGDGVVWPGEG